MQQVLFSTGHLKNALAKTGSIVSSNTVMSVLEDVKIIVKPGEAIILATDLESTIQVKVPCESMDSFAMCVPHKYLNDLIKQLPELPIQFNFDEKNLTLSIKTDVNKAKVGCEEAHLFPDLPTAEPTYSFTLEAGQVNKMGTATLFASTEAVRPAMTGVCLHFKDTTLHIVATDAHCLYKSEPITLPTALNEMIVIPPKPIKAIRGMGFTTPSTLSLLGNSHLAITNGDTTVHTRLIDARFPDYNAVIPQHNKRFTVENARMGSNLKLVGLSANKSTSQVNFEIKDQELVLTAQDIDFGIEGSSSVPILDKDCSDHKFALNAKLFEKILAQLGSEIEFGTGEVPTRALIFKDKESPDFYLLMPLMIGV